MADGAHPRSETADSRVSGAPGATHLVNAAASPKNTCNRLFFAVGAGAVSVATIMAIVILFLYATVGHLRRKHPSDTDIHSFCCPDEVAKMARYLNTSVDPCDDFFAYVCSSSIELSRSQITSLDFRLKSAMITGAMPNNVTTTKAGHFLNSFYRTCVKTISHSDSFTASLVSALLKEVGDLLNHVDSRRVMVFIMTAALKYSIHSVMHVSYQVAERVILKRGTLCYTEARFLQYLNAAVDALKRTTNSTATTTGTAMLAVTLCEQLKGQVKTTAVYYLPNDSRNFSREVWNIGDIEAAMNALGYTFDVKFVKVVGVTKIRLLYEIFNYTSGDTTAAYLLWHTVVRVMLQLNIHPNSPAFSPQVSETCTKNALTLYELWELFQAEILTTADKDSEVRKIFSLIKGTVHEQIKTIALIEAEDAEKRDQFFENVRLVTPMAESRASIPVPKATQDFAVNFFKGRRFNHEVTIARLSKVSVTVTSVLYRDLRFLGDRYILLPPTVYDFIRTGPNSLLPNMAILGQRLADSLWSMAAYFVKWEPRTRNNIRNFSACFYDTYTNNAKLSRKFQVLYASLGMSTILIALNWTNWHTVQHAWSLWTLSHAQFFYLLNSYYRCPNKKSLQEYLEVSVPVMYVQDFVKAFGCPKNASMSKARDCRALDQHHT
ncbi:hypothetical protein HPB49_008662 [Dermacentor silvarum]|uniref:Uncharacterized protein n=1 Tax=Dermacentor silvarum TaxID=543639 RepID=A0ACB8CK96_DERSI|nr:hypothetical protein HPB49_008662 [Dermacentor silvarum]